MGEKSISALLIAVFFSSLLVNVGFTAPPGANTVVSVQPPLVEGLPGDFFTINITIDKAEDVYAWEIQLQYPPYRSVLAPTVVEDGGFLVGGWFASTDDPFEGIVTAGCTLSGTASGVSGSGVLCKITFFVVEAGEGPLKLIKVELVKKVNGELVELPVRHVFDGYYKGPTVDLVRLEIVHDNSPSREVKVGETMQFKAKVRNDGSVPLYACVLFEIQRLEDGAYMSLGSGQWWYGFGTLPPPWWIDPLDCDGYYVSWAEGYSGVYWNYVGSSPWLDAIGDGNYIWADETQDAAMSAAYTFENISLPSNQQISRVVLEGYTMSTNINIDLDMYTISPTELDWLGSLWGTTTWDWHTPRGIGKDAHEAVPALATEAGLNSVELLCYHYAPDPVNFAGVMTADALRLQVQLEHKTIDPEEPKVYVVPRKRTLKLDPATVGPLHDEDIGTYIVSATAWYSYHGTWFNRSSKIITRSYWVEP